MDETELLFRSMLGLPLRSPTPADLAFDGVMNAVRFLAPDDAAHVLRRAVEAQAEASARYQRDLG